MSISITIPKERVNEVMEALSVIKDLTLNISFNSEEEYFCVNKWCKEDIIEYIREHSSKPLSIDNIREIASVVTDRLINGDDKDISLEMYLCSRGYDLISSTYDKVIGEYANETLKANTHKVAGKLFFKDKSLSSKYVNPKIIDVSWKNAWGETEITYTIASANFSEERKESLTVYCEEIIELTF